MLNLLLDTHIWLWLLGNNTRLPSRMKHLILKTAASGTVYISPITLWEISMLENQSKIHLGKDIDQWIKESIESSLVLESPLTSQILIDSTRLPGSFHKDPADRMIVATARANGLLLVTADDRIIEYSKQGYVNAVYG